MEESIMCNKYPDKDVAEQEIRIAGELNPGPWTSHSLNTGLAAMYISKNCEGLDPDKAYVLGVLHDIGRRVGIVSQRHLIEGYKYCMKNQWDDVARICLTHAFLLQNIESDVGDWDITDEDYAFLKHYIETNTYNDYDKLIQLCDALAMPNGFCLLEKRLVDVHRRYGVNEYSVHIWNTFFDIKEYFEKWMRCSIYDVLPNVKETTFMDIPLWKTPNVKLNE